MRSELEEAMIAEATLPIENGSTAPFQTAESKENDGEMHPETIFQSEVGESVNISNAGEGACGASRAVVPAESKRVETLKRGAAEPHTEVDAAMVADLQAAGESLSGAPVTDLQAEDETPAEIAEESQADTSPNETETEILTDVAAGTNLSAFLQAEYAALVAAFPGEIPFASLAEMPQLGVFLDLRGKGLSSRQAYLAVEGERQHVPAASVAHLRAAAPKTVAPTAPTLLSHETLTEWRRLFPHLSDREIGELYRRTAPKETY